MEQSNTKVRKMNRADVLLLDLYVSLKTEHTRLGERIESLIKLLEYSTLEHDLKQMLWYHWCEMRHRWHNEELNFLEYIKHPDLGYDVLFELDDWFDFKYYYTHSLSVTGLKKEYPALFWQNSLDEDQIKQTLKQLEAICNESTISK